MSAKKFVGLDFGTTNSAIAIADADGHSDLTAFSDGEDTTTTFRSILYFYPEGKGERAANVNRTGVAGPEAIREYLDGETKGRLIQSLKSYLPSRSFTQTMLNGRNFGLDDLIAIIIRKLREGAETQFGDIGSSVVVGRPVIFSGAKTDDDEQYALERLKSAIQKGGFKKVSFEFEPVAAAYGYEQQLTRDQMVLIGDFGGGTSDFSLVRLGPKTRKAKDRKFVLGNQGVPIAGDTFDSRIVKHLIAPILGSESTYRSMGKDLPVPIWVYHRLASWHLVSFLKSRQTMEMLRQVKTQAEQPERIEALQHIISNDLGYALYRAVEHAKVELSHRDTTRFVFYEPPVDIEATLSRKRLESWIADDIRMIADCVDGLLKTCNLQPSDVDTVFLTGGSAFVPAVRQVFIERFGEQNIRGGEELTTVARGLALSAAARGIS